MAPGGCAHPNRRWSAGAASRRLSAPRPVQSPLAHITSLHDDCARQMRVAGSRVRLRSPSSGRGLDMARRRSTGAGGLTVLGRGTGEAASLVQTAENMVAQIEALVAELQAVRADNESLRGELR